MRASIRSRRNRHSLHSGFELQLTSLLDILVIILVFLLKSHVSNSSNFDNFPGIEMPISSSDSVAEEAFHIALTKDALFFEQEEVLQLETVTSQKTGETLSRFKRQDLASDGQFIPELYDRLQAAKEKTELLMVQSEERDDAGEPLPFHGVVAIQADKSIPYDTLRRVLFTAGTAGYRVFRLLAKRPQE